MRNFTLKTEDGELLSYANSIWTNIDTKTGLPARLTDEDTRGYELDEKLEMDYAPRKIALPEGMEAQESFAIQKHHLDTHHHVNNCQYPVSRGPPHLLLLPAAFLSRYQCCR